MQAKITMLAVCDNVEKRGGKTNFIGAFTAIHAYEFPVTVGPFYVVMRAVFADHESLGIGRLMIIGEDGEQIQPPTEFRTLHLKKLSTGRQAMVELDEKLTVTFPRPGDYSVFFSLGDSVSLDIPLRIARIASP
jgi:hypothetical protein